MLIPGSGVCFHLPHERASGGTAGQLVLQPILVQLDRAEDALLPPRRSLEWTRVNLVAEAMRGEPAVGNVEYLLQGTLEDQAGALDRVALVFEKEAGLRIA